MLFFIFKPIPKELNKKTFNFKPPISHIIIDIRTKKTLDSLEAKNRTNIARRPAKVKTLDSLDAKNITNIIIDRSLILKALLNAELRQRRPASTHQSRSP